MHFFYQNYKQIRYLISECQSVLRTKKMKMNVNISCFRSGIISIQFISCGTFLVSFKNLNKFQMVCARDFSIQIFQRKKRRVRFLIHVYQVSFSNSVGPSEWRFGKSFHSVKCPTGELLLLNCRNSWSMEIDSRSQNFARRNCILTNSLMFSLN